MLPVTPRTEGGEGGGVGQYRVFFTLAKCDPGHQRFWQGGSYCASKLTYGILVAMNKR